MRMEQDRMPKIALQNKEMVRRPIGRLWTRWMDQAQKDMEAKGANWRCVAEEEVWKDQQDWKRMCQTTCLGGNRDTIFYVTLSTWLSIAVKSFQVYLAKSAQQKELELLEEFAAERGFGGSLKSWDVPYWKRKQQRTIYSNSLCMFLSLLTLVHMCVFLTLLTLVHMCVFLTLLTLVHMCVFLTLFTLVHMCVFLTLLTLVHIYDEEELREYFPFPQVLSGLFTLCENLFGLTIMPQPDVDTWHPDVQYYHIFEGGKDTPIAGFYLDPYEREEEKLFVRDDSGWMVALRTKTSLMNTNPLAALVFNFPQPLYGKPSLLPFRDVLLLFQKDNIGTTRENRDWRVKDYDARARCGQFITGKKTLPASDMAKSGKRLSETHMVYEPSTLASIGSHYESRKPLPDDIVDKLCKVRQHLAGYDLCQELYLSALDLELHTTKEFWLDIVRRLLPQYSSFPLETIDSHPCAFLPVFTGQWGAAYYCHLWARIIAADAFSAFREVDRRNSTEISEIGRRFRNTILASGGGCHPSKVFRLFRGRDPSPNALLYTLGLKEKRSPIR
uniref:Peptidase M3A/M3B catalytic domain-containing protein n=1 Tax=Timema cristinae TaxID=61476 RepID=A0A7R9GVD2_TIMCR|nr:unnamed protein product [Timema cristinae]